MNFLNLIAITFITLLFSLLGLKYINKYLVRSLPAIARNPNQERSIVFLKNKDIFTQRINEFVASDNKLEYLESNFENGKVSIIRRMSLTNAPKIIEILFSEESGEIHASIKCRLKYQASSIKQFDFGQNYKLIEALCKKIIQGS